MENSWKRRYEKLENLYFKSERLRLLIKKRYQQKFRDWKNTLKRLQKPNVHHNIEKIFNPDQWLVESTKNAENGAIKLW